MHDLSRYIFAFMGHVCKHAVKQLDPLTGLKYCLLKSPVLLSLQGGHSQAPGSASGAGGHHHGQGSHFI